MSVILIVDDEPAIRNMLREYLADSYDVVCAESGAQGLALLAARRDIDLVVSDISMPGMDGLEFLGTVRQRYPAIKRVHMTANDIDHIIKQDNCEYISNIIAKTVPFNFPEFGAIVKGLVTGEIFGLKRYLLPDGAIIADYRITTSEDGRTVREQVVALLEARFGKSGDMRLVLDEIITNAVYHASSSVDGREKYPAFSSVMLLPDEYVYVQCGFDAEKYGVSVTDIKGRLKKETVLCKIERQISGEGLLDDSGRGIHMSRLFADRMVINIDPGKKTEVVLLNYFSTTYQGHKPLYINEL
jgi:CheY-like chemotaxis protein/anti-sigma regulatory factor (Ser/Thr protein kinase)